MEHSPHQDVNRHIVGKGALRNAAVSLGMAGKGDLLISEKGGTIVSGATERQASGALQLRLEKGELRNTDAISTAAREELTHALIAAKTGR
ncbi:MAG: hypothetical protein PHO20_04200 [Candidatus Peribacteraceae bacterium]|nr:hypothetical protein [Candidatus Peribacteraceae bacterium]MDD5739942.1 hypothetical protein [Candidatus Peribacteraceae bacterium]